MPTRIFEVRLPALLAAAPPELLAYQRWLDDQASSSSGRDYLFLQDSCRFEPRAEDVLVCLPRCSIRGGSRGGSRVRCELSPGRAIEVEVPGVSAKVLSKLIEAIDGKRCLAQVRWHSGIGGKDLGRALRALFGKLLLAPAAVTSLERQLSATEIVRFPAAPYCVERPYWENMIAVRKHFLEQKERALQPDSLIQLLRELHILALLGPSLDRYYRPASPIAERSVAPAALYHTETKLLELGAETLFVSGPRVKVPALGGEGYWQLLCEGLGGDPSNLDPATADAELSWGRVVVARAEHDPEAAAWFCPPRPINEGHWLQLSASLGAALRAADADDPATAVDAAARFHRGWVRLHPFHNANQCLAMNVVNAVLTEALGAGMPHLFLDHLALQLSESAYREVFRRAVGSFVVSGEPAERLGILVERRQRSLALMDALSKAKAEEQRAELLRQQPEVARWALLEPAP